MQIELMQTATALKPGQAIKISRAQMIEAAKGSLDSLLFDSVRDSDIAKLAEQMEQNWDVRMTEDALSGEWTMLKSDLPPYCPMCNGSGHQIDTNGDVLSCPGCIDGHYR
jgi:hypothetical protein